MNRQQSVKVVTMTILRGQTGHVVSTTGTASRL